jgi:hypothetical protein
MSALMICCLRRTRCSGVIRRCASGSSVGEQLQSGADREPQFGDADTRVANAASVPHGRQCPHAPVEPVPSEIHGRRRSYSFLTTR